MSRQSLHLQPTRSQSVSLHPRAGLTVDFYELAEREGHVAGAGRHVDDEYIKPRATLVGPVAPVDVKEELLDGLLDHEAAPDDGGVRAGVGVWWAGEEEAHGHARDAVVPQRDDRAAWEYQGTSVNSVFRR